MTQSPGLTRRAALAGAAALPLSAAAIRPARAAAPMLGASPAPFMRVKLGGFDVTNMLAATRTVPDPHNIFGLNVEPDTFAEVSAAAGLPTDRAQFFFTPPVVNTGTQLILFDTGLDGEATTAALAAAGYTPDQVDIVVITHMHGDHIGGLWTGEQPTYPNASYMTGRVEFDEWSRAGDERFDKIVKPLADQITYLEDGGTVASGITAMEASGHTPGHMTYMLESEGKQMLLGADFANHYVWSLAHPTWEVKFDMDKETAATSRKRLLDMLAADKVPFSGYHMPFPAFGFVETRGEGYHYVPHSYQLLM